MKALQYITEDGFYFYEHGEGGIVTDTIDVKNRDMSYSSINELRLYVKVKLVRSYDKESL